MNATALILVDLQAAAFGGFGIPALHDPDHLLRNARTLLQSARASSVPVIRAMFLKQLGSEWLPALPDVLSPPCVMTPASRRSQEDTP